MRIWAFIGWFGLLSGSAFNQISTLPPVFEFAEVHASPHLWNSSMQGGNIRAGRYEVRQATMLDLIGAAYGVDEDAIYGGPDWLDWDRFDIIAKTPPGTSPETARLMLRQLLANRFGLAVHNDTKLKPGMVLTLDKGDPKLRASEESDNAGCQSQPPPRPAPDTIPYITASCHNLTMEAFASDLRALSPEYIDNPVVNFTGLKGAWDFDLKWTPKGPLLSGRGGISLPDAMTHQLGLKLQPQRLPMPVIVVDNVKRMPTENPSAAATLSPSAPTEFEVASIKPSESDAPPPPPPARRGLPPSGLLRWYGIPLRDLITQAFDLDPDPHAQIPGAPKWLDSARFDLVAKAPSETTASGRSIFSDDLARMLRALLIDRFRMATHYEQRSVDVYTLVAVKPKLRKADPSNRPSCKMAAPQPPRDPAEGPPPRMAICQNVTMEQFARSLLDIGRSYIRYPVEDATGLEGFWDFSLTFNPAPPPPGGRGPGRAGPPPDNPPEQLLGISLFAAVEKQLGLKLRAGKRLMPVLVIDHIEQKATDN